VNTDQTDSERERPTPMSASRLSVGTDRRQPATEQLFASSREDIARLTEILRGQACIAVMRGIDGVVLPLNCGAAWLDARRGGAPALCAPIYDSEGHVLASLEVTEGGKDLPDSSQDLLRALIESAARAISERWFRLAHCRHWVLAAMPRNAPGSSVILAVDGDQRLLGADRKARQWLEMSGRRFEKHLGLAAFFETGPNLLRRRGNSDVPVTLPAASSEPWVALITPPYIGAIEACDGRAVLHARPRLDLLTLCQTALPQRRQRGLSHSALRCVEEYIEAHLDSPLDIEELAAIVRMSPSHFTRSFHRSAGVTPHRYVVQCRIMRARELLTASDLPLTEIALNVGFSDQSHFCRRFHELVGVPPGAFRGQEGRFHAFTGAG
jgi:AraC-like DNA-binding protein